MTHAQTHRLGDGFGGEVWPGAQPQALQALKRRGAESRQQRAPNRANRRGRNLSSRAHNTPQTILMAD